MLWWTNSKPWIWAYLNWTVHWFSLSHVLRASSPVISATRDSSTFLPRQGARTTLKNIVASEVMASLVRDKGGEERPLSLSLSPSRPLYSTENRKQSQLSHTPLTTLRAGSPATSTCRAISTMLPRYGARPALPSATACEGQGQHLLLW